MIFFSDMDGTFLTPEKRVSETARQALDALVERGIEFVPCTGRALSGIPTDVMEHPAVHFAVCSNGATVAKLDRTQPDAEHARTIYARPLPRELALKVRAIARDYDVTFDIFADGACLIRRDLYERLSEFVDDANILRSMIGTRTPLDEEPEETIARVETLERVAMYWKDPRDRDAILARLSEVDGIDVTRSYPMNIEVMAAGISKGSALAWLCGHLGIDVSDATAFGDNINDIPMLEAAGTGVAVANAEPEVLAAADVVCGPFTDAGAARYILEQLGA